MIPPPEVRAVLRQLPWQLTALQFVSPPAIWFGLIWWKIRQAIRKGDPPQEGGKRRTAPAGMIEIGNDPEQGWTAVTTEPTRYRETRQIWTGVFHGGTR